MSDAPRQDHQSELYTGGRGEERDLWLWLRVGWRPSAAGASAPLSFCSCPSMPPSHAPCCGIRDRKNQREICKLALF
eukprot:scaffold19573_cov101-Isochrysis_galbana.AAC.1